MRNLLAAMCLFGALSVCAENAAPVWCVGESVKVKPGDAPQEKNLIWDGAEKRVSLSSAKNEYVAFQIAIRAPGDDLQGVTVVPDALKSAGGGEIPVENIELFVEHYLMVAVTSRASGKELFPECTPGEHPTQMVPFNARQFGAPFAIWPDRNQPVWVDIYVPEDAAAGVYSGTFKVKAGERLLSDVNVSLTVWDFALPHETHFRTFLYTGPENLRWAHRIKDGDSPKFKALEDKYFQMAHQHRLNFNVSGGGVVDEIGKRYVKYYDGSAFTERVGKGAGQNLINMPPEGKNEAEYKESAKRAVELVEEKKLPGLLIGYVWDEPHSAEDFAESKKRCGWIHDAVGKKMKTFIATPQWEKYDAGDVDIYSEPKIEDIPKIIARGDSVWSVNAGYTAGPYVDAPGYGGRSIPWMVWRMDLGGWQFWDCCYWVDRQNRKHREGKRWVPDMSFKEINENPDEYLSDLWRDPLNFDEMRKKGYKMQDAIRINGDGLLFYPGHDIGVNGPIASFAMKSLRRGAQDYEYLWLAKQKGKDAEVAAIVASVCPEPGKWSNDPEEWDRARLKLGQLLAPKNELKAGSEGKPSARR